MKERGTWPVDSTECGSVSRRSRLDRLVDLLERLTLFRAAIIVFLVASSCSVILTYGVRPLMHRYEALGGEGYDGYLELGVNLARGNGYVFEPGGNKVFHRPPLYPLLLTPAAFLSEDAQRLYVAFLNSALFVAASIVVFLASELLFGRRAGWFSWLIFAASPPILVTAKNAVSAICQAFVYILIFYFTLRIYIAVRVGNRVPFRLQCFLLLSCYAGVMCHGTILAATLCLLCFFAGWAAWMRRSDLLKAIAFVGVSLALMIAPWAWRNYQVTGMFIPIAGNSGLAYFAGNAHWGITLPAALPGESQYAALLRHAGLAQPAEETIKMYGFTTAASEKFANERMKAHVSAHPRDFVRKLFLNASEFYFPVVFYLAPPDGSAYRGRPLMERLGSRSAIRDIVWSAYHLVLVALSTGGIITLWRRQATRPAAFVLFVAWAASALPYFPFLCFVGNSPYTIGTLPVLSIIASALALRRQIAPNEALVSRIQGTAR